MKVQIGDLVQYCVRSDSIILLEGFGLVIKKADPDLNHMDKHSRVLEESWIIYDEDKFWFIREKYFLKIYKTSEY
jgi:hypothetical protein